MKKPVQCIKWLGNINKQQKENEVAKTSNPVQQKREQKMYPAGNWKVITHLLRQ